MIYRCPSYRRREGRKGEKAGREGQIENYARMIVSAEINKLAYVAEDPGAPVEVGARGRSR